MVIRNINGTSDNKCKCLTWLDHWKKYSGRGIPTYCPTKECMEKSEVGAHVQKEDINDNSWYIIPLCKKCNAKKGQSLTVSDTPLVSANVKETCGS